MTEEERLVNLYKLVTNYNFDEHQKSLPSSEDNSLQWFKNFKFLNPASWAASPQKIPYIAATTLIDSYSCLPHRPDMAFSYLWTAINNSYNDLLLKQNTNSDKLTDTKGIENSLAIISSFLNSKVDNKAIIPDEHESKTVNEILVDFAKRLPDKNLNFLGSYILKGMAISIKNSENTPPPIRKIHVSSSYQTFKKRFKTIHNHLYWNYGKKYSSICAISESTDKTSIDFGIKEEHQETSRMITRAVRKELQRILVNNPELGQFDDAGNPIPKKAAFKNDIDKLEFLVFGLLYASRNNNIHGNVASRLNSIFANSKTITAATWNFLFGYFYLSLLLLALQHIELDDLDIHLYNVKLLKVTNKDYPVVSQT
jgi:hypothetical protein